MMPICSHCKGTGEALIKLQQECIGCQRKITVTFESTADLVKSDGRVFCADCKAARAGRDDDPELGRESTLRPGYIEKDME
jgi:hypothetical protein